MFEKQLDGSDKDYKSKDIKRIFFKIIKSMNKMRKEQKGSETRASSRFASCAHRKRL